MDNSPEKHGDERVEELLSQLKGIFGKLARPEEPGSAAPAPSTPEAETAPPAEPLPATADPYLPDPLSPTPVEPPMMEQAPLAPETTLPPELSPLEEPPAAATAPTIEVPPGVTLTETPVPDSIPGVSILLTAIFYPDNRLNEAKTLAQKLETMTPKFMKVAFRLNVRMLATYNPKTEWREGVMGLIEQQQIKAVFVVNERPLEEAKRRVLAAELEGRGIYFQEVAIPSLDKKPFFTDMLLGIVFFFDSQKPPTA